MGQTNRNLAAKHAKGKSQRIEAGKLEGSKACYTSRKMTDAEALTSAIVSRPDVLMVQGVVIRRAEAATKITGRATLVNGEMVTSVKVESKPRTMRQILRAHW